MKHLAWLLVLSVLALYPAVAGAQYPPGCYAPAVSYYTAPTPFVGSSYAFSPTPYGSNYAQTYSSYYGPTSNMFHYGSTQSDPLNYQPGPYWYTPTYPYSMSYYSYYYTPGYYRY